MPAAGTDATDRVDVDLLPVPGEDPATTMDDAVAALEGFLGNNKSTSTSTGTTSEASAPAP